MAVLWPSTALTIYASCSLWAAHVSLAPHEDMTFDNATVGGIAKGPWRRWHLEDRLIRSATNTLRTASKCGPRGPHWFITKGGEFVGGK